MIENLSWDSTFFDFSVGKIFVENPSDFNKDEFFKAVKSFRLVYVFSRIPFVESAFMSLVDVKLTFQKSLFSSNTSTEILFFDEQIHEKNSLFQLAYESGKYSRFRTDPNFATNDFFSMYEIWVNKSIESKQSSVMIEVVNNDLLGFVTVDFDNSDIATIGLIAVSQKCRGQGVGGKLLIQAENLALKHDRKLLKVATQKENVQASAFYQKNGFVLADQLYIYHFWNL